MTDPVESITRPFIFPDCAKSVVAARTVSNSARRLRMQCSPIRLIQPGSTAISIEVVLLEVPARAFPALIHFLAEVFVFFQLLFIEKRANLYARCLPYGIEFGLGLLAQFSEFPACFIGDFAHLIPLSQIQAQIVVKLVDVALRAFRARSGGIGGTGHASRIEICDHYTGGDPDEKHAEHQNLCFQGTDNHCCSSGAIICCSTTSLAGTPVSL